ncbi:hypothetical protein STCU_08734 [Strigomonas culicis]|uniref:Uncharacterized protein n=1 Tax=Strigomonas culicis TaxID=28005 RepID=S9TRJ1_9TRYP|nr:hypothetical protein STCU_08734 [Strigomonas culicis]|eukprot:EPY21007.1 hypothetical protein STCU_08734 [Strigomonas culicis]
MKEAAPGGPTARGDGKQLLVKLPLAPLLFMLSELSLIEEALLQHLTAAAVDEHDPTNKTVLLAQLPYMEERELLLLLVSFHRFGLQNEHAFDHCVKRLRRLQWRSTPTPADADRVPSSTRATYWKHLARVEKAQLASAARPAAGNDRVHTGTLLETLAGVPVPSPLTLPVALLLEVLTALALSVHRRQDVVQMVVRLLVANVGLQFARLASDGPPSTRAGSAPAAEEKEVLLIMARQVKRAIELCESMLYPQLLLVELFAELREATATGVLADGGEQADIPSDRVVYYDHVTADLVKLSHVAS